MMKKTLAALAVLGAFAGAAAAADVTLYGKVDLGLNYQNTKTDSDFGRDVDSTGTFSMKSGQNSGSRWGLKGVEDLGNGTKVGFVLENGFSADDGTMGQGGRLFGREAQLYVQGSFGKVAFGRMGSLTSACGTYNLINFTPFSSGWSDSASKTNFWISDRDRMDNTVTYQTPTFAGFQVTAQYSFKVAGQEAAGNESQNKRYVGLGATYKTGALSTGLIVDSVLNETAKDNNTEDSLGVTFGATYDFGFVKPYFMAQYGQNENKLGGFDITHFNKSVVNGTPISVVDQANEGWKGYGLNLGATAPLLGGTVLAQVSYLDSETEQDVTYNATAKAELDARNYGVALGYTYNLSKRTMVYTYASYNELELKAKDKAGAGSFEETKKLAEFGLGMVHSF